MARAADGRYDAERDEDEDRRSPPRQEEEISDDEARPNDKVEDQNSDDDFVPNIRETRRAASDRSDSPPARSEASERSYRGSEQRSRIASQVASRVSHSESVLTGGGFDGLRRSNAPPKPTPPQSEAGSKVSDVRSTVETRRHDENVPQPFNQFVRQQRRSVPPPFAAASYGAAASYAAPRQNDALMLEKQSVLMDIERLKLQGIQFSKTWTTDDRLEDMQYEMRRHMLHIEEVNNMNMMRDGMRMICTGIEMVNGRMKLLELNGWAAEICADMTKYDPALSRLYRKYWRRSASASPEMEIAMGVLTSMGMYHFKRKVSSKMFAPAGGGLGGLGGLGNMATEAAFSSRPRPGRSSPVPSESDSEGLPP